MQTNKVIEVFQKTPVYKKAVANPRCIGVLIGGSRLGGVEDEKSDYDITVLYDGLQSDLQSSDSKSINHKLTHFYVIDNYLVHWYSQNLRKLLQKIINIKNEEELNILAFWSKITGISRNSFIYYNKSYLRTIDNLIKIKQKIAKLTFFCYLEFYCEHKHLRQIINNKTFHIDNSIHPKFYYNILFLYLNLVCPENKELLNLVKQIKNFQPNIQEMEFDLNCAFSYLQRSLLYFDSLKINKEQLLNEILQQI